MTRSRYRALMMLKFGFYDALDPVLASALDTFACEETEYKPVSRAALLGRDVAALEDNDYTRLEIAGEPVLPEIDSPETLSGVLYVVEGSLLGGSLICRAARRLLGNDPAAGYRYWDWCRLTARFRWPQSVEFIDRMVGDEKCLERSIASAQATFQAMDDWLAKPLPGEIATEGAVV